MAYTETELFDRHRQSLGEAHRACQMMGKNAADDYLAARGPHYTRLCTALDLLEGTARQMAYAREDTRWLKLGILYAKAARLAQKHYVQYNWAAFSEMMKLFEQGQRHLDELNAKTGHVGPILPQRPSDFLIMPDHRVPGRFQMIN